MMCTAAVYKSKEAANQVSRGLRRRVHLDVRVALCEHCDSYHLKGDATHLRVPPKGLLAVRQAAMGYSFSEISRNTGIPTQTIYWNIKELKHAFGAMSVANLVAIFISLGIIDPNEFVPQVTERTACA